MDYGHSAGNFDRIFVNANLKEAFEELAAAIKENYPELDEVAPDDEQKNCTSNCVIFWNIYYVRFSHPVIVHDEIIWTNEIIFCFLILFNIRFMCKFDHHGSFIMAASILYKSKFHFWFIVSWKNHQEDCLFSMYIDSLFHSFFRWNKELKNNARRVFWNVFPFPITTFAILIRLVWSMLHSYKLRNQLL